MKKNVKTHDYEGPDRRGFDRMERVFFGLFNARDIFAGAIYIISVVITITVFWLTTSQRIEALEEATIKLTAQGEYLVTCQQQSDNYHASVIGDQFKCGAPISGMNRIKKIRNMIDREAEAVEGG